MAGDTVGLIDIAARLPALVLDAPVVARGTLTAFLVRGSAKKSIGRVFQDRAARYPDHVFIRFDDEGLTYREANETVNRYAATLAEFGANAARDARGGQTRRDRRNAEPQAAGQRAGTQRRAVACQGDRRRGGPA